MGITEEVVVRIVPLTTIAIPILFVVKILLLFREQRIENR